MIRTDLPTTRSWRLRLASIALCGTLFASFGIGATSLLSCGYGTTGLPQCEDHIDNDSDGLTDIDDPACQANPDAKESQDPPHACEDGIDNDADGFTDFPDDPNCNDALDQDEFGPLQPQCMDERDNDGDGKVDFPLDPGCLVPNQNTEDDDCPDGENCPECGNGIDDDFDGNVDFGGGNGDVGCTGASDQTEFDLSPTACGPGVSVTLLPQTMQVAGMIPAANSQQMGACGGVGAEIAYVIMVPRRSTMVATTTGTTDTVVYIRRNCSMPGTELACNDNNPDVVGAVGSKATVDVNPGSYFIVVDGKGLATSGAFTLKVDLFVGQGEACTGPSECAPGYVCRTVPGAAGMTCERPICSDTRDDDMDGKTDFPNDPGCLAPDDGTETDDCPNGPNCPDCGDGVDNDGDMRIDFGMDPSCSAASSPSEADCPVEVDPVLTVSAQVTNGTTAMAGNQFSNHSCQMTSNAPDRVHMLAVRAPLATLVVDLSNSAFDTILDMYDSLCMTSIACDDDSGDPGTQSKLTRANVPVGTYALVIDGFSTGAGAYTMRVSGTYANNAACDPLSPWFTCATAGFACTGAPGVATCVPAACNDAMDQDGDGFPGFPTDPGCTSTNDGDETDDCPNGPNCPQCGNHLDDDLDGATDFPADSGCTSASTRSESCSTTDPVRPLVTPTLTGQTFNALANDFDLGCLVPDGRDEVYRVRVDFPIDMLRIDTIGAAPNNADTAVGIRNPSCAAVDAVCDDNGGGGVASQATLIAPAVGDYFVIVDDKGVAAPAPYNLRVTGHYLDNARCNPVSPFTCNAGFTCLGAAGAETCTGAACNDLTDADGDGQNGFPGDPGCSSTSDNDETDDCHLPNGPAGPMCPQCGNRLDDDMDGLIDYPADPACTAASTNSELAPCTSMDPVIVYTTPVQGATTMGKANDIDLTCGVDGRDDIYRILVNRPLVSLSADTFASDTNTAVAIRRGTCNGATDLNCGTNNFGTNDARATITNVMPGEYFAIVDDLNTATPTLYNLNVRGVLMGAAPCTPGSTFVCDTGFNCLGPPGNTVCSPGVCNDNVDADGDGRVGFPSDPGCTDTSDTSEADDCNLPGGPPGPMCPQCANGLDDDNDTFVDYPNDIGCTSASKATEVDCAAETDPVIQVTVPLFMGNTTGLTNNFNSVCSTSFSPTSPDRVHILTLPVPVTSLLMDTENSAFDTVLIFGPPACTPQIECDDDDGVTGNNSLIQRGATAAGTYTIVVDGFSSGFGAYNLHVVGTAAAGTACTSPLFASGVLVCAAGTSCNAGTGVCQ